MVCAPRVRYGWEYVYKYIIKLEFYLKRNISRQQKDNFISSSSLTAYALHILFNSKSVRNTLIDVGIKEKSSTPARSLSMSVHPLSVCILFDAREKSRFEICVTDLSPVRSLRIYKLIINESFSF